MATITVEVTNTINQFREKFNDLSDLTGDQAAFSSSLSGTTLFDLVQEIDEKLGGSLSNLTTDDDSSIIDAINSLDDNVGSLPELKTIDKSNIVSAVNENVSRSRMNQALAYFYGSM